MSHVTLLIYMDSSDMAPWMWIQSLSQFWTYHGHMSPSFPWWISFDDFLQEITHSEKEHFPFNCEYKRVITWRMEERMEVVFTSWVCSLSQLQTGCRGCTREACCFGFPQQQQWTQDSTIMKRNVAERRDRRGGQNTGVGLAHAGRRVLYHIQS